MSLDKLWIIWENGIEVFHWEEKLLKYLMHANVLCFMTESLQNYADLSTRRRCIMCLVLNVRFQHVGITVDTKHYKDYGEFKEIFSLWNF